MSPAATDGGDLRPVPASDRGVEDVCELPTPDGEVQEFSVSRRPEEIGAVPIHRRPDLLAPCADLVNCEWQRSRAARVHALQKSCPEFPVCLVLLRGHGETERLLGHARLSRVAGRGGGGLLVESVVVSGAERGKGYGRTLMEEAERYAGSRGFTRLCLTTRDKQHFYSHLGYVLSAPVQNVAAVAAAFAPCMEMLLRFSRMQSGGEEQKQEEANTQSRMNAQVRQEGASGEGPPPPPSGLHPPPPPPPPIPPAPPPPPQSAGQLVVQTLTKTPYRDARGVPIYWMHKDI